MSPPRMPIAAAQRLAEEYGWDQIIVATRDSETGKQTVVTWGKTKELCDSAANVGNGIKRNHLGWPEHLCHAKPRRTR